MTDPTLTVILEEYKALRVELMYFLDAREKLSQLTMTLFLGQAIIILNFLSKVSIDAVIFISCIVFPLVVCLFYWRALDYTKKILTIAKYIDSDLKSQIESVLKNKNNYFMWENYKGNLTEISTPFTRSLDYSKWWLYWFCIFASWVTGYMTAYISHNHEKTLHMAIFSVSFVFIFLAGIASYKISREYNEFSGAQKKL